MGMFQMDIMQDTHNRRLTAARAYLPRSLALERLDGLTVCSGAVATKLEFNDDGSAVTGVHLVDVGSKRTARQCYVKAKREVIVAGGAIFSPQFLMLSGIGPRRQLESHKIQAVHDLPGVGANLSDHVSFGVNVEVRPSDSYQLLLLPLQAIWHLIVYLILGTGIFSSPTTKQAIWLRSGAIDDETMEIKHTDDSHDNLDAHDTRNIPDIELIFSAASHDELYTKGKGYYGMYTTLAQPASRGRIALTSDDPLALPLLHHPLITDPRDKIVARKAARIAMRYIEALRETKYGRGFVMNWHAAPGVERGTTKGTWRDASDDEEVDRFIEGRLNSTLHLTSTCRMAKREEGGVVGQDLKVHGIKNLRVADASVFPALPCAHTMAPTFLVAERCADFIKTQWA